MRQHLLSLILFGFMTLMFSSSTHAQNVIVETTSEVATAEVIPTETPTASAPPVFILSQTDYEVSDGLPLTLAFSVIDEAGIVRLVEDVSATTGMVFIETQAPLETAPPYTTTVTLTYTPAADFAGMDTFTLTAIDAAGERASLALTVNVLAPTSPQATAEATPETEDGLQATNVPRTFTVNDNTDGADNNLGDGLCDFNGVAPGNQCTLRAAIEEANDTSAKDTIRFTLGTGPQTLLILNDLPFIAAPLVIDGTTQPGCTVKPCIGLDFEGNRSFEVIPQVGVANAAITVKGLAIFDYGTVGINLRTSSDGSVIQGNYIGLDLTGTAANGNTTFIGIQVQSSGGHLIGGTTAAQRNVIGDNLTTGIGLFAGDDTTITGNFIGTDPTGTASRANGDGGGGDSGIFIDNSSDNNVIGGTSAAARNLISSNGGDGIRMLNNGGGSNKIQGNFIGTDVTGTLDLGNSGDGIQIDGSANVEIGGIVTGARNVISGNGEHGIRLENITESSIQGNIIGLNAAGNALLGNTASGVFITGGGDNLIGGATASARNILSGNGVNGVEITSSTDNLVQGNFIGTNLAGNADLGNLDNGVHIDNSTDNIIGGTTATLRNVISGNSFGGVRISGAGSKDNIVSGNFIGVGVDGRLALGNGVGVQIVSSAFNNVIGGTVPGAGNIIANQTGDGIFHSGGTGNRFLSNSIFNNADGIDLFPGGVTLNDPNDADGGANNLQNFPDISDAVAVSGTRLLGGLISTANRSYRLQFFSNPSCAAADVEGRIFLGDAFVTTNALGAVNFDVTVTGRAAAGLGVTATATDLTTNDTSEFSPCVTVSATRPPAAPVLTSPANNATVNTPPVLSWQPVSGATIYVVEIARDANFTQIITSIPIVVGTSANAPGGLNSMEKYYWRVRASNSDGVSGPFSAVRIFNLAQ
jgi:CSLREA domain-containing protein